METFHKTFYETATTSKAAVAKAKHKMRGAVSSAGAFKFKASKVDEPSDHATKKTKKSPAKGRYPFGGTEYGELRDPGAHVVYRVVNPSTGITHEFDNKTEALHMASERSLKERGAVAVEQATLTSAGILRYDLKPQFIWRSEWRSEAKPTRHHAMKKSPAQLQREIDEVLANPGGASGAFDPPRTMNVVDRHGGFTAVTRSGTLWRPGKAAPGGTFGSLVPGSVKRDDFYQNKQPVVSALYKLPSYGYKVKVWWEPSGERIA